MGKNKNALVRKKEMRLPRSLGAAMAFSDGLRKHLPPPGPTYFGMNARLSDLDIRLSVIRDKLLNLIQSRRSPSASIEVPAPPPSIRPFIETDPPSIRAVLRVYSKRSDERPRVHKLVKSLFTDPTLVGKKCQEAMLRKLETIELYYGLKDGISHPVKEIALRMSVSRCRVNQLKTQALIFLSFHVREIMGVRPIPESRHKREGLPFLSFNEKLRHRMLQRGGDYAAHFVAACGIYMEAETGQASTRGSKTGKN